MLDRGKTFRSLMLVAAVLFGPAGAWAQATDLACDRCVGKGDIADEAVTAKKIKSNSVFSPKILDRSIRARDIGFGEVGAAELADGTISTAKLADGAVGPAALAEDAVFERILVLRADPADPVGNCDALLAALAGITDNDAANRYLIHLEPGTYDCGATPVQMKPFVDIQGSGRGQTLIVGSRSDDVIDGVVRGAGHAELRRLSVTNVVVDLLDAVAIYNDQSDFRITDVRAESATIGAEGAFGIVIEGTSASAVLTNVEAAASPANSISAGIVVFDGARADLIYVVAIAGAALDTSNGLLTGENATVTVRASSMTGTSGGIFSVSAGDTVSVVASNVSSGSSGHAVGGFGTLRCIATYITTRFVLRNGCTL